MPDPTPGSVFVITAHTHGDKAEKALFRVTVEELEGIRARMPTPKMFGYVPPTSIL